MSSVIVQVIVEGQTEQTFVRDVLVPYLAPRGLYLTPCKIGKPGHKGGNVNFDRAKTDIGNFLKQQNHTYITTMFDFYGIDSEWPGIQAINHKIESGTSLTSEEKSSIISDETKREILRTFPQYNTDNRFIPYFSMHEFESLLFSDAQVLSDNLDVRRNQIDEILQHFKNPEDINDDPETAPSKRIMSLKNSYRKVAMGKIISETIGISTIRKKCPHFGAWLQRLENL